MGVSNFQRENVDGVEQGNWVFRNVRGAQLEGCFVDGKKSGRRTEMFSNCELKGISQRGKNWDLEFDQGGWHKVGDDV